MRQFAAIAIAFTIMPFLSKVIKKGGFGPVLLITGFILGAAAGLAPVKIFDSLLKTVTTAATVKTIVVVVMVGALGNLLKKYGFMDLIVSSLEALIPSKKKLIMLIPFIMGLLTVPGGAHLSAPFADSLGKDLGMPPERRAVINLSFRHVSAFVLPFGSYMLFVQTVDPGINIYALILLNLGFVAVIQLFGYLFYVRPYDDVHGPASAGKLKALGELMLYLSPVYLPVILNAVLDIEMYIAVFICVAWLFILIPDPKKRLPFAIIYFAVTAAAAAFLAGSEYFSAVSALLAVLGLAVGLIASGPRKELVTDAVGGINLKTVGMLIGVYFIQNLIKNLDVVMEIITNLFLQSSGPAVLLIIAAASLVFGLSTGLSLVPMGIIMPLVYTLPLGTNLKLVYTFFVFAWSFLGYYYSPLHLCQLLTVQFIGCDTSKLYKEHFRVAPFSAIGSFLLFYIYRMLMVR